MWKIYGWLLIVKATHANYTYGCVYLPTVNEPGGSCYLRTTGATKDGHRMEPFSSLQVELQVKYPEEEKPKLSRGPLPDYYAFKSLHFHWATCPSKGCEHFIDGFCHPIEMHLLHERDCAKANGSKYLVVAFFFQLGEEGPVALDYITQAMNKAAKNPHKKVKLRHNFSLCDLFQPFTCEYLTYKGSFTTPPCTEGVTWILNPYPLSISKKQLEKFRAVNTIDPALKDNFRPCQPLNGRKVYFVT